MAVTYREDIPLFLLLLIPALTAFLAIGILIIVLFVNSIPILRKEGVAFLVSSVWAPSEEEPGFYGIAAAVMGSVLVTLIALVIALPLGIAVTIFINEYAMQKLATFVSSIIAMAAGFPTVIYGLWGIEFLTKFVNRVLAPALHQWLGFVPLFSCTPNPGGFSILTAGLLLGIMATPYTTALINEVYRSIPMKYREAAYSLGVSRIEVSFILLGLIKPAILGAALLAIGRAVSETVAVTMVIGNTPTLSLCILGAGQTVTSLIATQFGNAELFPLMTSALYGAGLVLLGIGMTTSFLGVYTMNRWRAVIYA